MEKQWQKLLDESRQNYLSMLKLVTNQQENLMSAMVKYLNKPTVNDKARSNALYEWINTFMTQREEFIDHIKEKIYESLAIMPGIDDSILRKRYREMMEGVIKYFNDFFARFRKV